MCLPASFPSSLAALPAMGAVRPMRRIGLIGAGQVASSTRGIALTQKASPLRLGDRCGRDGRSLDGRCLRLGWYRSTSARRTSCGPPGRTGAPSVGHVRRNDGRPGGSWPGDGSELLATMSRRRPRWGPAVAGYQADRQGPIAEQDREDRTDRRPARERSDGTTARPRIPIGAIHGRFGTPVRGGTRCASSRRRSPRVVAPVVRGHRVDLDHGPADATAPTAHAACSTETAHPGAALSTRPDPRLAQVARSGICTRDAR